MMLRDRSGDFMRDLISEASGFDEEPGLLDAAPFGSCSRDSCVAVIQRDGREYRLLATRSTTRIDWQSLVQACAQADIAVSDRWLPRSCAPRWLKLDRKALEQTGGVALYLNETSRGWKPCPSTLPGIRGRCDGFRQIGYGRTLVNGEKPYAGICDRA